MNFVVLDSKTKVIKRITNELDHLISDTEILQEVSDDFDISGGGLKLDELGNKVVATEDELDIAFTPKPSDEVQAILDSLDGVISDQLSSKSLSKLANNLKIFYTPKRSE